MLRHGKNCTLISGIFSMLFLPVAALILFHFAIWCMASCYGKIYILGTIKGAFDEDLSWRHWGRLTLGAAQSSLYVIREATVVLLH